MATLTFQNMQARSKFPVAVAGQFETVDGLPPVNVVGDGFTVARTGEGDHLVTFSDTYDQDLSACVSIETSTATADKKVFVGAVTTTTLQILSTLANAPADLPGDVLHFQVIFRNVGEDAFT